MAELEALKPEMATWVKNVLTGADVAAKGIEETGSDHPLTGRCRISSPGPGEER
jgi:hypothetical protein